MLLHYVFTTKRLFYYNITSLLRRGCFCTTSRLRRGCFTTTSRHHYEGVVLLQHPLYVSTTNDLFAYTCFTTVTCTLHIYFNYYFCANFFLLLLSLGNSSKFRKPLGINKGVRLYMYFVFPRIHRS